MRCFSMEILDFWVIDHGEVSDFAGKTADTRPSR
jgi:hypothetical protein